MSAMGQMRTRRATKKRPRADQGTRCAIRYFLNIGGADGTTSMETFRVTDRKDGPPQSQSQIQAPVMRTLERSGCSAASFARHGQHADWRNQPEASAAAGGDPEQGSA